MTGQIKKHKECPRQFKLGIKHTRIDADRQAAFYRHILKIYPCPYREVCNESEKPND